MRIDINEYGILTRAIKNGSDKNLLSECRPFAYITMENGAELTPETAICRDNRVKFRFSGGLCVDFLLEDYRDYVIITVEKADPCIEKLRFVNAVSERRGNDVLAGMALTLETNAAEIPGLADCLWAEGYRRFGIGGCAYALIACDLSDMREIMQRITVKHLRNIPYSTIGGAFAADYDAVQGSYIFNFDGVTHENADRWIAAADAVGATQVDFHIGRSQRFGDCVPSLECYPKGYESLQGGIACLHANGIQAGLHTYAHFIAPNSYFVTPIPDKGLGAAHLFTLREEIDANTDELTVNESTDGVNTITGFFVRNTLYLTIDDEVIQFNRVTDRGFSECVRGALGTVKAPHRKGSMVKHLKGCFGLFSPDPDTDLFYKVAEATAEAYNVGNFDMIYLDALDGDDVFAGTEYGWYYGTKFVFEIVKRLKKPAIIEMSTMHHTLWYVRSRMGAWDHATRAYKKLIDAHAANNRLMEECCTLPHTLGWYHFGTVDPTFVCQYDRGFTDDYEYLCQKALRDGYSLAFANLSPALLENNAEVRRYAKIIRKYEKLRLSGALNGIDSAPSYKGEYFLDEKNSRLLPIRYESLFLEGGDHRIAFSGKGEACCLRIENRPAVKTKEEGMLIYSPLYAKKTKVFSSRNVIAETALASEKSVGEYLNMKIKRGGGDCGYARAEYRYPELLNMEQAPALGLMVKGDGKGELLDIQLRSPLYMNSGTFDRTIRIDFVGWKYVSLIESNAETLFEDKWPFSGGGHYVKPIAEPLFAISPGEDSKKSIESEWYDSMLNVGIYHTLRENVKLNQVESISFWVNGMKLGETYEIGISEVRGYPICCDTAENVCLCLNGNEVRMSGTLPPLGYFEWRDGEAFGYDRNGAEIKVDYDAKIRTGPSEQGLYAQITIPEGRRIKVTLGSLETLSKAPILSWKKV